MTHSFKIKLLNTAKSKCRTFDSREAILEYAGELAKEGETTDARLVITKAGHSLVIRLSCPLYAAIGYLQDFSIPSDGVIPEPPHRRRRRSRNSVRH